MSLLLALTGTTPAAQGGGSGGGPAARPRRKRYDGPWLYDAPRDGSKQVEEAPEPVKAREALVNELLLESASQRQETLLQRLADLQRQQEEQQLRAAMLMAELEAKRAARTEQLLLEVQLELQRIEEEIEEIDVAFITSMLN